MRLFVYGTLRREASMHSLLEKRARWLGPARAPGRLLDLGAYPGLVAPLTAEDRVVGELYELPPRERDALLDSLDRYEGPLFRRESVLAWTPAGETQAWCYRYRGPDRGRPPIPGGDFFRRADPGARPG